MPLTRRRTLNSSVFLAASSGEEPVTPGIKPGATGSATSRVLSASSANTPLVPKTVDELDGGGIVKKPGCAGFGGAFPVLLKTA